MIHVKFYNCFPISPTGHRSLLGIVVEKIPEPEEIDKVILEVYHSQPRIEIKPPSLFEDSEIAQAFPKEKKTHWEYDTATGEEQQTLIPKEPKTDKGEFIGDLFSYDE